VLSSAASRKTRRPRAASSSPTPCRKSQEGEIIAVGPGALDDNGKRVVPEVKVGDFVLFGKWSGTEVKVEGQDLLIMKESDIMGILEGRTALKKKAA